MHEITVPAVKDAIKQGLKLVEDLADSEKNFEPLKNKASAEVLKLRR